MADLFGRIRYADTNDERSSTIAKYFYRNLPFTRRIPKSGIRVGFQMKEIPNSYSQYLIVEDANGRGIGGNFVPLYFSPEVEIRIFDSVLLSPKKEGLQGQNWFMLFEGSRFSPGFVIKTILEHERISTRRPYALDISTISEISSMLIFWSQDLGKHETLNKMLSATSEEKIHKLNRAMLDKIVRILRKKYLEYKSHAKQGYSVPELFQLQYPVKPTNENC